MATPGIFSKTGQNAALFATFVAGSAALIVGKKGIMWAGNKAYNIAAYSGSGMMNAGKWAGNTIVDGVNFTLKDGGITGPTSAGILAGTAIGLTYKYSAIAASHQLPIKKPGHEIGNRSIVMMTSVFALTAIAIRYSNSKFSSHQVSLMGALSYASIATVASILAVGVTSDTDHRDEAFHDYLPRAWELLSGAFTSDASRFWGQKHPEQPPANYISQGMPSYGPLSPEQANHIAQAIENSQYKGQTRVILNELVTEYSKNPEDVAMIFSGLSERRQSEIRGDLNEGIQRCLPATAREIREFWSRLDEETPAEFVGELVSDYRFTQSAAKRCAQHIEAHDDGRQVLTILNALVETEGKNPESVAMIFMQLSETKQAECRARLSEEINRHLPPTAADSVRFWEELETTPAARIYSVLPREEYAELEEGQTKQLAFFIENYRGGHQVVAILNDLVETHKVNTGLIGQIAREFSERTQRHLDTASVREVLHEDLLQSMPRFQEREFEFREMEEDFDQSLHAHKVSDAFSWNESAKMGIYAGLASGVVTAVAYFGVKSILAFGNAFPVIKGSIPAAVIMAPTFALAHNVLSKDKYREKYRLQEKQRLLYSMVIAAALGTVLTPTLSSFMLKKKVGYIASAGYSLPPIAALFLMRAYTAHRRQDRSHDSGSSRRREYREERY